MASSMKAPRLHISVSPLTAEAFAPFGTVIENPVPSDTYPSETTLPRNAFRANQNTAIKHHNVTHMPNLSYPFPNGVTGKVVLNMFVCYPRQLRDEQFAMKYSGLPISQQDILIDDSNEAAVKQKLFFDVKILERHPYTLQMFVPMGLDQHDTSTCYLVIVAPTLDSFDNSSKANRTRRPSTHFFTKARNSLMGQGEEQSTPTGNHAHVVLSASDWKDPAKIQEYMRNTFPKGSGPPDLPSIRAFLATGNQAVTYGAGTWHAPMVVLGTKAVSFVVVQAANGVPDDDCQEVELDAEEGQGISVVLDVTVDGNPATEKSRLLLDLDL